MLVFGTITEGTETLLLLVTLENWECSSSAKVRNRFTYPPRLMTFRCVWRAMWGYCDVAARVPWPLPGLSISGRRLVSKHAAGNRRRHKVALLSPHLPIWQKLSKSLISFDD